MNNSTSNAAWFKASRSNGQANCVEVAYNGDTVLARDSKAKGQVMSVSTATWKEFVSAISAEAHHHES